MAEDLQTPDRKVAVITGASSGIGYATALEFAENGYNVVIAARRLEELNKVARECDELGAETLTVITDVDNDDIVHDLCREAELRFGHVDVWINNAGVYLVGKFEDTPLRDMKRIMETNFFGYVHGSQAALKQFRKQGYGTLINVSSVNAAAPQPYVSIYSASKAAIRAMDEALRMEIELEGMSDRIHVCTAFPASTDTNLFQNAANYSGHEVRAVEPVYDPTYVAKRLYQLAEKPKREKYIGPAGTVMALQRTHLPGMYERQIGKFTDAELLGKERVADTHGNLYAPLTFNQGMRGGWREKRIRADEMNIAGGAILAAVVGLIGYGLIMSKRRRAS